MRYRPLAIGPDYSRFWHPWLRVERLIRSILETQWDREARQVMKFTLRDALRERDKICCAGWMN